MKWRVILVSLYLFGLGALHCTVQAQDSLNVTELGRSWGWGSAAWDVALYGDIACVAMVEQGLALVDVSDPENPFEVGRYHSSTLPTVYDVAVIDHYAYAVGDGLLEVADISDPARPEFVAHVGNDPDYTARAITVHGENVYVASARYLHIVGAARPDSPLWYGYVNLGDRCAGISAEGNLLCLVSDRGQLFLYDISNPTSPQELTSNLRSYGRGWGDVALAGEYAYWAAGSGGLKVVELQTPNFQSRVIASVDIPDTSKGIGLRDNTVYVAASSGIWTFDVSDPTAPQPLGVLDAALGASSITLRRNEAYIASGDAGLRLLNLSAPGTPVEISRYDEWGWITGLAYYNGYLLAADPTTGLSVLSVTDPAEIRQRAATNFPPANLSTDIALFDHYALLSSGDPWFRILDVTDPLAPQPVGSLDITGIADIVVHGDWAFALTPSTWVSIDISDPATPRLAGGTGLWTLPEGELAIHDTLACVPSFNDGLVLYDISDPAHPDSITQFGGGPWYFGSAFYEDYLLACFWDTLYVLGLDALPALPRVATIELSGLVKHITPVDGHALVSCDDGRLWIVNLGTPTAPAVVGYADLTGPAEDIVVDGTTAYVTCTSTLHVLDIASALPATPHLSDPSPVPNALTLHECYPNPFNAGTTFAFDMPHAGLISLRIYDLLGRAVVTVAEGRYPAGRHTLHYNASALPSGLYFARLTAGSESRVQKLALLK